VPPVRKHVEHSPVRKHVEHSPVRKHVEHSPVRRHVEHSAVRKHVEHSPVRKHVELSPVRECSAPMALYVVSLPVVVASMGVIVSSFAGDSDDNMCTQLHFCIRLFFSLKQNTHGLHVPLA